MSGKRSVLRTVSMAGLSLLGVFCLSVVLMAMAKPPQNAGAVSDVDPHKAFGNKNAPLILEVFSDFQCPACKNLYTTTNRELMDNYVSSGKMYLIHRDFPLPMHAHSKVAAEYARAAATLGKTEVLPSRPSFRTRRSGKPAAMWTARLPAVFRLRK